MIGFQDNIETAKERIPTYVKERIKGSNKQDSMLEAGYTKAKARVPNLVEATKVYQSVVKSILSNTSRLIDDTTMAIKLEELASLPVKERVAVLKQLAEIHKILMPSVKIKEEELRNGEIKRTKWSSVGD